MKISKKTAKIINVLMIALAVLLMAGITVNAEDMYLSITPSSSSLATKTQTIGGTMLGVAQVIGMAVAVIMLIVLAIKYISTSPNDKAEIKKYAVVYIVGAIVLFAASGIVELIKNWSINSIK